MKRSTETEEATGSPAKRSKILFQTRCNPKLNYNLVQKFKDSRGFRKALTDIGLDGLLQLRITRLQRELCADLARRVDCTASILTVHGKQIPLNYPSVTRVLGLPCTGSTHEISKEITKEELADACIRFGLDVSGRISLYSLLSDLEQTTKFDEEFKAKLFLFTIATMLRPTSNVHLYFREFIPLLNSMDQLKEFNWAKFVLDGLLHSIPAFQAKGTKSLGGCLLYLQLLYLHCISPVAWGVHDQCLLATPCLRSWTDQRVNVVITIMREQGGLDTSKVVVRTAGLPTNNNEEISLLPQLLMHQVGIQQNTTRQEVTDQELSEIRRGFLRLIEILEINVEPFRDLFIVH